jgi:hypothetical protein
MSHTLAVILALVLLKVAMLGAMGGLFWGFFRSQPREADDWSETRSHLGQERQSVGVSLTARDEFPLQSGFVIRAGQEIVNASSVEISYRYCYACILIAI